MTELAVTESPPEGPAPGASANEEFETRVASILEMIAEDPSTRDRMLAEMYVTMAEFSEGFRRMQTEMASLGPQGILKMMFGGKAGNAGG